MWHYAFANATDLDGQLLPLEVAAVELLNIIRPTVALTVGGIDGTCTFQ